MGDVVSIQARRQKRVAEEHARALVVFECAAALARQSHPGLLRLIEQSFGQDWLDARIRETAEPRTRRAAPPVASTGSED